MMTRNLNPNFQKLRKTSCPKYKRKCTKCKKFKDSKSGKNGFGWGWICKDCQKK